jgi:3-oxoacyl-[acyl-carrier-protein] synthase II
MVLRRRVVITGLGVLSPLGIDKEKLQKNIIAGKSGIQPITRFDASPYPCKLAGETKDFDPLNYMSEKETNRTERCTQFALAATQMAMKDAGITEKDTTPEKTATSFGTTIGGVGFLFDQYQNFMKKGPLSVHPYTSSITYPNALSSHVAIAWNAQGPSKTFSSACTSSSDAISYGFDLIKAGKAEVVLAGGSEALLFPMFFASISLSKILSERAQDKGGTPRPFDVQRDGTILSEGAGVLVLEDYHRAMVRSAQIYAEIIGYGFGCDAYRIRAPHPEARGIREAIQRALLSSKINPEKIDYIQAHGTGTKIGDLLETRAIKEIFGQHAYSVKVSAIKSMLGHLMGASGAVELCASLICLSAGMVPPTINYKHRDPHCDLDYVPNMVRKARVDYFMSNCFGFGGKNSVLILRNLKS